MVAASSRPTKLANDSLPETNTKVFKGLLETLTDPAAIVIAGKLMHVNRAHVKLAGFKRKSDMLGMDVSDLVVPEDAPMVIGRGQARQRGEKPPDVYEFRLNRLDGRIVTVQTHSRTVLFGGAPAVLVILRDITQRQEAEDRLRYSLSLQRATLESTADAILVIGMSGEIVDFNQKFLEMWNLPADFALLRERDSPAYRRRLTEQLKNPGAMSATTEEVLRSPSQSYSDVLEFVDGRLFERYAFPQKVDEEVVGIVWNHRDVTETRRLEQLLSHQANHDPLTDLLNRRGFRQELEAALASTLASGGCGALLLLDLDQFKEINDTMGHPVGDQVLARTAAMLREELGASATLARLGGDEFALIMTDVTPQLARQAGQKILELMRHHIFDFDGGEQIEITGSVGVVLFPDHGSNVEELMSRVDIALYGAKDKGRNRFEVYATRDTLQKSVRARMLVRRQLNEALQNDSLHLMAQPILDLSTNRVTGHELLLRLKRPDGTFIGAPALIDVAERTGMIVAVDRWVTRQAIRILAELQRQGSYDSIEVNLSGRSLDDLDLLAMLSHELAIHKVDPKALIFEVTETAAISNLPSARRFIESLKSLGCRFALDDFGVGFSSLNHLQNLPVDYLKIDGSFVRGIVANVQAQGLVRGMITIARALDMKTIAESVGTSEETALVRELGADFAQGFWIGRPRDASRVFGESVTNAA